MPALTALSSAPLTAGLVGVIGDGLDVLGDHVLDGVDLAFVVRPALALAEDDLDVGVLVVVLLHRVDHDVVEVDRELGDETDLDDLVAVPPSSQPASQSEEHAAMDKGRAMAVTSVRNRVLRRIVLVAFDRYRRS